MTWKEIESGVYREEFGGAEGIYCRVAGVFAPFNKEHYRVHSVCSLEFGAPFNGRDKAAAIKEAWAALLTELPTLAVYADPPSHKIYRVLDDKGRQEFLNQTFFLEPPGKTSDAVIAGPPRVFPTVHFLPSTNEVVFQCSHWRIDALGTNWIIDRLFTLLGTPSAVKPVPPTIDYITPALEDAYGSLQKLTPEQDEFAKAHIERFRKDSLPNDRLPYKGDIKTPPGNPVRFTIHLTKESTSALIDACKSHKITPTTAVMAALGQTVFALADMDDQSHPREKHDYTFATSVNWRKDLIPPYNDRSHATGTFVIGTGCRVRRGVSFIESARTLCEHFHEAHADVRIPQCLRAIYKYNGIATPANQKGQDGEVSSVEVAQPPPPCNITISSLGRINEYVTGVYGQDGNGKPAVKVHEYDFGIEMMTRQMVSYIGTFNGRLMYSISYNEGYYDENVPKSICKLLVEALANGLGLELEVE